jgi:hypothetical protein
MKIIIGDFDRTYSAAVFVTMHFYEVPKQQRRFVSSTETSYHGGLDPTIFGF